MTNEKNEVKTTKKIFLILEELADNNGSMKLKDIAESLGYPVSTTHRLLSSLIETGYVYQNTESGEYTLGVRILSLANAVLNNLDLRRIAYPYLKDLRDKTSGTANLVINDQDESLYIEKVESNSLVRVFSLIGKRAPLYATGVGKVLLADMAWSDVLSILKRKGMEKITPNTIADSNALMEELNKIRKQGYGFDNEECEVGAWCVAAPVRDYTGRVIASISISFPKYKVSTKNRSELIKLIVKSADALSDEMGYVKEDFTIS